MHIPELAAVEANLKNCLLLKADDILFTLGDELGECLRNEFIGIEIEGLADENVSDEDLSRIDLDRFAIAHHVRSLHAMVSSRALSGSSAAIPDSETARQDWLEFIEYFLSTLPTVAMGGLDTTSEARGAVREVYTHGYAWLNLVDAIENAFQGNLDCDLTISDLALLSGLDRRTVHNRCGPNRDIRTTVERFALRTQKAVEPAFVRVHPFDAIAWLCARPSFRIEPISSSWMSSRFGAIKEWGSEQAATAQTRAALIASMVNGTPLMRLAGLLSTTPEECRNWFDLGTPLSADACAALSNLLNVTLIPVQGE